MRTDLDDHSRLNNARSTPAARLIAGALTPANVVLALMAYLSVKYTASLMAAAAWWLAALVLVVGVPYLILFRALRNGSADDRQVVRRSQRPALMASAAGAVTFALVVLYLAGAPRPLVWLILAMICGLVAMGLTTMVLLLSGTRRQTLRVTWHGELWPLSEISVHDLPGLTVTTTGAVVEVETHPGH